MNASHHLQDFRLLAASLVMDSMPEAGVLLSLKESSGWTDLPARRPRLVHTYGEKMKVDEY